MLRAVFDPNVLVAALLTPDGVPGQLIRMWREGCFELVVSPRLLAEVAEVLSRPKFQARVSPDKIERSLRLIGRSALRVRDPETQAFVPADPKDDYLVCLALHAGVHALVSGDVHLLALADSPVTVLSPREFLQRVLADTAGP